MNKFIKLFLILTTLLIIFVSCSGESTTPTDNPTTDNPTIKSQSISKKLKLNISDATNLYIGKSTSSSSRSARAASNDTEKKLFKITEDGYVQEITYTYEVTTITEYEIPYEVEIFDEEGNVIGTTTETKKETTTEVTTETATDIQVPSDLVSLNSKYLIVCFDSDNYLVNKDDGYCYKYTNDIPTNFNNNSYCGENLVSDKDGNIYFLSNNSVKKLNISNQCPQIQNRLGIENVINHASYDGIKGISRLLYDRAIQYAKDNGYSGIISGRNLKYPEATLKVLENYLSKKVIGNDGRYYYNNERKLEQPVYLLDTQSSYKRGGKLKYYNK